MTDEWEGDIAHAACRAWIGGWRHAAGEDAPRPDLDVMAAVGRSAAELAASGRTRHEITRAMWEAGKTFQTGVTLP